MLTRITRTRIPATCANQRLGWKELVVYGSTMRMPSDFEAAYDLIRDGRARVHVDSVFPLAEAAKAHERLESGAQFGKVVLQIPG